MVYPKKNANQIYKQVLARFLWTSSFNCLRQSCRSLSQFEQIKKKLDGHDQNITLVFRYLDELLKQKQIWHRENELDLSKPKTKEGLKNSSRRPAKS